MRLKKSDAFLLMELLVVFAVITVAACLPLWYVSTRTSTLPRELKTLQSWLLFMQQKALVTGKDITITFDKESTIVLADDDSFSFGQGITIGYLPGTYGPPSAPTKLLNDPITFNNHEMIFYHDGAMQVGACYFIDNRECSGAITCGLSKHGTIRCYKLQGKKWQLLS